VPQHVRRVQYRQRQIVTSVRYESRFRASSMDDDDESRPGRERDSSGYVGEPRAKQCVGDDGQRCLFRSGASRTGASVSTRALARRCHRRCHPGCHQPRRRRPSSARPYRRTRTLIGEEQGRGRDRSDPQAISPKWLDRARGVRRSLLSRPIRHHERKSEGECRCPSFAPSRRTRSSQGRKYRCGDGLPNGRGPGACPERDGGAE
jgi:hypothetical protein